MHFLVGCRPTSWLLTGPRISESTTVDPSKAIDTAAGGMSMKTFTHIMRSQNYYATSFGNLAQQSSWIFEPPDCGSLFCSCFRCPQTQQSNLSGFSVKSWLLDISQSRFSRRCQWAALQLQGHQGQLRQSGGFSEFATRQGGCASLADRGKHIKPVF